MQKAFNSLATLSTIFRHLVTAMTVYRKLIVSVQALSHHSVKQH